MSHKKTDKKVIAVIFGGRSVEHDVSILTGLQFLEALDPRKYIGLPVYIDPLGQWWTGSALKLRNQYPMKTEGNNKLTQLWLDLSPAALGRPHFNIHTKGLFGEKTTTLPFDVAIPAIHGSNGEDGSLQGMLDFAGIPYAGCRPLGAAATMNKAFGKQSARNAGIKVLPDMIVNKPDDGVFLDEDGIKKELGLSLAGHDYPFCVKPCNLGSSVGVSKVDNLEDLMAALVAIFRMDGKAVIEPFVPNLVEYNVAVRRSNSGEVLTSAIEEPNMDAELLNFKNKYLAGGNKKSGGKIDASQSEGMASLNRTLNPKALKKEQETFVRVSAAGLFSALDLGGSVRIDFLSDRKSGEIWLNEVNTIPGSFAYFLWEAAHEPINFMELADEMIIEALKRAKGRQNSTDTSVGGSQIF